MAYSVKLQIVYKIIQYVCIRQIEKIKYHEMKKLFIVFLLMAPLATASAMNMRKSIKIVFLLTVH